MTKHNKIAYIILLITVTIATIYFLSIPEQQPTGMHGTRVGTARITFGNETPPPTPPPTTGGGSGAKTTPCCENVFYEGIEYQCRCMIRIDEVIRLQPTKCCKNPTEPGCENFCTPVQRPTETTPIGICPIERTCGSQCCKTGEYCRNGKCTTEMLQPPPFELPPPPEIEQPGMIVIPFTPYAFPWWYFLIAIILLLILSYLLLKQTTKTEKPAKKPKKRKRKK